eukprot:6192858-Pleurochrysis_carterae.AAC.1
MRKSSRWSCSRSLAERCRGTRQRDLCLGHARPAADRSSVNARVRMTLRSPLGLDRFLVYPLRFSSAPCAQAAHLLERVFWRLCRCACCARSLRAGTSPTKTSSSSTTSSSTRRGWTPCSRDVATAGRHARTLLSHIPGARAQR